MSADVFISYKSDDYILANQFRLKLLENGVSCWMAPESIKSGDSYGVAIPNAIRNCKVFLLIMTRNIFASKWVPKELDGAINAGVRVFPIMIENLTLEEPYSFFLADIQCYYPQNTIELTISKTVSEIKAILAFDSNTETPKGGADRQPQYEERRKRQEDINNGVPRNSGGTGSLICSDTVIKSVKNPKTPYAIILSVLLFIIMFFSSNNTTLLGFIALCFLASLAFLIVCLIKRRKKETNYSLYDNRFTGTGFVGNNFNYGINFSVSFFEITSINSSKGNIVFVYNRKKYTVFAKNFEEADRVVGYIVNHKR